MGEKETADSEAGAAAGSSAARVRGSKSNTSERTAPDIDADEPAEATVVRNESSIRDN